MVTALVLVAAAVALIWAGRLGYWIGLVVASLVAMLLLVVLARRPGVAGAVVTAVCALPPVLLAVPAARRPRPTTRPAPSAGGWGEFAFMLVIGGLFTLGGLALALTGRGGDRHERGVVVPYSGLRQGVLLVAIACLALAMLGFVVFADAFADDPGESVWPVRLVGVVGAVFFGVGGFIFARRGLGRRWRVLLTPSAVVIAMGRTRTVVPWAAIQQVRTTEVTTHVRGVRISEPLVGIDLSDPQAIQTGPLERLLLPLNRRLAADITLPVRTLDIDPPLLYEALRYYHQHPPARDELNTPAGLARIQNGQLT
jgi:MFS family permease